MRTLAGLESLSLEAGQRSVVTIGNFDGVHRGHQQIIRTARRVADRAPLGGPPPTLVAMTFDPHPAAVLSPGREPPRLTTVEDRLALLESLGVDLAVVLRSDLDLLRRPALDFLEELVQRCRPAAFVEGASFMFGRGRQGNVTLLAEHAERLAYSVTVVDTYRCTALPDAPPVSSSAIRGELAARRVERAAEMLGRPYCITGVVGHGEHRGTPLGFPTANLESIPQALPGEGVYACRVRLPHPATPAALEHGAAALERPAAVNVGRQPTFGGDAPRVEAHLLDFAGDLSGARLTVSFLRFLRPVQRFASAAELAEQIARDVHAVRQA